MAERKLVYLFNEDFSEIKDILGDKGVNLAEMTRMGLPVPFGFTLAKTAYEDFREHGGALSEELLHEIDGALSLLSEVTGSSFGDAKRPLFVAARVKSGIGKDSKTVPDIGSRDELLSVIVSIFESGECDAISVQQMVYGNRGDVSGRGEAFTRNPRNGAREVLASRPERRGGPADGTAGELLPLREDAGFAPRLVRKLGEIASLLERYYRDMQEIEYVIEDGHFYIIRTRKAARSAEASIKVAADLVSEGVTDKKSALLRIAPERLTSFSEKEETKRILKWADEFRNIRVLGLDDDVIINEDGEPVRRLVRIYWSAEEYLARTEELRVAALEGAGEDKGEAETKSYPFAALLWTPMAVLKADEIAKVSDVIYFDLTKLSEAIYGIDAMEASELKGEAGKLLGGFNPFRSLDSAGAGALIKLGIEAAHRAKPGIKIGIYGPYGEDLNTMRFLEEVGGNYILCDREQHAAAKLAAAQAVLLKDIGA